MKRLWPLLPLILLAFLLASCGSPAEPYYSDGNAHYEKGEYEEAIADFTEAIRLDPNHVASHQGRGLAHYALGEYDEAIEDYSAAIRLDANSAVAYANRGAAYLELGEYGDSISDCTEAIRLDPDLAVAYCARGAAYLELGRYDEAMSDCSEAIRLDPDLARAYNNRAAAHNRLGEYDESIEDCTEAIRLDPNLAAAYSNRAVANYELGNYEETIDDCSQALRLDPDLATAYKDRAAAHIALDEHEEAVSDCSEAIRLEPNLAAAYSNRAVAHYELGNYEETIDDCTEAIRLDPGDAEAYFYRCRARGQLGDYEQSIDDCTEAISLEPGHAGAYCSRGVDYVDLGRYDEAMSDYDQAIRLDPELARAYYNRGLLQRGLGEYEEAIDDFTEAIRLDPRDAWAYYYRGLAHYALDEYEEAIADYTKAAGIEPDLAEAYHERGLAHYYLGDYAQASADRKEAARLDPACATDLSDVVLSSQDLPLGFVEMPLGQLGLTDADLSEEGFTFESMSAFVQAEPFEMVMAFTLLTPTEFDQTSFDVALRNPDIMLAGIVAGMGATEVSEANTLPGLDDIGDASAGFTLVADMQGLPLRVDLVMFRRDTVGALVMAMYLDGQVPPLGVGEIARTLEHKIDTLVPGLTPAAPPESPSPTPPAPAPTPEVEQQPPLPSADHYPMAVGNYWVWRWTLRGDSWQRREEVTGTRQMNGATVFVVRRQSLAQPGEYSELYRSVTGGHVYWHGSDSYENGTLVETSRPIPDAELWFKMPLQIGNETRTTSTIQVTEADGNTYTIEEELYTAVEAIESVEVPAGHFDDCYRIRDTWISEPDFDTTLMWLCPRVGLTKVRLLDSSYEDGIGLLVELIEYRVE